ncbi:MAG: hypothetical protein ACHQ7M_20305 [Chloroflexota bacterium]
MALAVLGLGLLGSQAGHLLAYQVRFGAAAQQIESSGAHTYFPAVAKAAMGAGALALIGGLLLVGLARILSGRRIRSASEPSYLSLLAVLFSIQLAAFLTQEIAEALIAGSQVGSAPDLVLWGTLGQLPIAAIAALAFRWLSARVETALLALASVINASPPAAVATHRIVLLPFPSRLEPVLAAACPAAYIKRGPPPGLRS